MGDRVGQPSGLVLGRPGLLVFLVVGFLVDFLETLAVTIFSLRIKKDSGVRVREPRSRTVGGAYEERFLVKKSFRYVRPFRVSY